MLFADDTRVHVQNDSFDGPLEIVNTELAKVAFWFDSFKLTFKVNQTFNLVDYFSLLTNEVILRNEVASK